MRSPNKLAERPGASRDKRPERPDTPQHSGRLGNSGFRPPSPARRTQPTSYPKWSANASSPSARQSARDAATSAMALPESHLSFVNFVSSCFKEPKRPIAPSPPPHSHPSNIRVCSAPIRGQLAPGDAAPFTNPNRTDTPPLRPSASSAFPLSAPSPATRQSPRKEKGTVRPIPFSLLNKHSSSPTHRGIGAGRPGPGRGGRCRGCLRARDKRGRPCIACR